MRYDQTFVEEEIHIAATQFGALASDENFIDNDPDILADESVEDKNAVARLDAARRSCLLLSDDSKLSLHDLRPFFEGLKVGGFPDVVAFRKPFSFSATP